MSSIEAFRSSINKYTDFARNSRFIVLISAGTEASEILSFRCEEAELPGRTFSTFEARTYGPFQKYPALTSYNEMNLTFLCSGNQKKEEGGTVNSGLLEKRFFEGWMNFIQQPTSSSGGPNLAYWNFSYKNSYTKIVTILHYDVVGESLGRRLDGTEETKNQLSYGVKLINAFPTSINQIALSWGNDEVSRLVVTLAYDYWEQTPIFQEIPGAEFLQPLSSPQSSPVSTQQPRLSEQQLQTNRAELRTLTERLATQNAQQTPVPGGAPT